MSKERLETLLANCISIIRDLVESEESLYNWLVSEAGFEREELEKIGCGYLLDLVEGSEEEPDDSEAESTENVKRLLCDIHYELMAHSAWCAHAYAFENMYEYCIRLATLMEEHGLNPDAMRVAYARTKKEFDRISESETLSFLNSDDTKRLEMLDDAFLDKLAKAAQKLADLVHLDEDTQFS